ncbi:hypothetical protein PILCRDRAFT_817021 [Piloderma croceum F 1598]|uniref:Uncharacterized protein n=1 Tax=Piloderma croceum (strain F 1598) TaxID=765440 RepID=A0A0C3G590_PILCF|nr:hypothetical protein PILCRDRAFT_817021 [Piloderma croceum F 1598]
MSHLQQMTDSRIRCDVTRRRMHMLLAPVTTPIKGNEKTRPDVGQEDNRTPLE